MKKFKDYLIEAGLTTSADEAIKAKKIAEEINGQFNFLKKDIMSTEEIKCEIAFDRIWNIYHSSKEKRAGKIQPNSLGKDAWSDWNKYMFESLLTKIFKDLDIEKASKKLSLEDQKKWNGIKNEYLKKN